MHTSIHITYYNIQTIPKETTNQKLHTKKLHLTKRRLEFLLIPCYCCSRPGVVNMNTSTSHTEKYNGLKSQNFYKYFL